MIYQQLVVNPKLGAVISRDHKFMFSSVDRRKHPSPPGAEKVSRNGLMRTEMSPIKVDFRIHPVIGIMQAVSISIVRCC